MGTLPANFQILLERLQSFPPTAADRAGLVEAAIGVWRRPGFDTLASLPLLRFEPFDYQMRAASVVLRQMAGRAILADEVGLGKTIEAGIVLSELRLRGLASEVLVLAPAGLVGQWAEELERKFALPTLVADGDWRKSGADTLPAPPPVVLASLATARRQALRDVLTATAWDLVVVDEAHRVKNPRTASAKLVRALRTRYLLLLTATPVENRIEELHQLVSLVRPGHLGTIGDFRRHHGRLREEPEDNAEPGHQRAGRHGAGADCAEAALTGVGNLSGLRRRLREVMVRHRRSEVALMLPRRLAETIPVRPGPEEAELYRAVSERVREASQQLEHPRKLVLRTVQQLAGSSPRALAPTLERMGWPELARAARGVPSCAKSAALLERLERHRATGDKVIVFSAFRETLIHLCEVAERGGFSYAVYHGGLSRREKDAAVQRFEHEAEVLLSTESAGEGRNLQFCHAMVNFDLPWNPMQIEQRLGRIHRIGQRSDVVLSNLVARGTIEERILEVLHAKLNLFELVVGELDMVLGRISEDFVFEEEVFDAHLGSLDDEEFASRLDDIGALLLRARADHRLGRERTDALVAELQGEPAPAGNVGMPR